MLMKDFATLHNSRVISWKYKAFSSKNVNFYEEISKITGDLNDKVSHLISIENSELTGYFVAGAPIIFTSNISPLRGIANGTKGYQYGLNWLTQELHDEAIKYLNENPGIFFSFFFFKFIHVFILFIIFLFFFHIFIIYYFHYFHYFRYLGDCELPNHLAPSDVLVEPAFTRSSFSDQWPKNLSVVADKIVFAVPKVKERIQVGKGSRYSFCVTVEKPAYELAFVNTIHKMQGATVKRLIISLLKRPNLPSRADFHSIYVALTRVTSGSDFRILGDANDLSWVNSLRPPKQLIAFLAGYDKQGIWDYETVKKQWAVLAEVSNSKKRKMVTFEEDVGITKKIRRQKPVQQPIVEDYGLEKALRISLADKAILDREKNSERQ